MIKQIKYALLKIMIYAWILMLGGYTFWLGSVEGFLAATHRNPTLVTAEDIVDSKPSWGWFRISNCYVDYSSLVMVKSPNKTHGKPAKEMYFAPIYVREPMKDRKVKLVKTVNSAQMGKRHKQLQVCREFSRKIAEWKAQKRTIDILPDDTVADHLSLIGKTTLSFYKKQNPGISDKELYRHYLEDKIDQAKKKRSEYAKTHNLIVQETIEGMVPCKFRYLDREDGFTPELKTWIAASFSRKNINVDSQFVLIKEGEEWKWPFALSMWIGGIFFLMLGVGLIIRKLRKRQEKYRKIEKERTVSDFSERDSGS